MTLKWTRTPTTQAKLAIFEIRQALDMGLPEAFSLVNGTRPGAGDDPLPERRLEIKYPWSQDEAIKLGAILEKHGYSVELED